MPAHPALQGSLKPYGHKRLPAKTRFRERFQAAISQRSMPDEATATSTVGIIEKRDAMKTVMASAISSYGLLETKCGAMTESSTQAGAASIVRAIRGESVRFFKAK